MNAFRDRPSPSAQRWLRLALGAGGGTILVVLLARTAVGAVDRQPGPLTIAALSAAGFALALTVWRLDDAARRPQDWPQRTSHATIAILGGLLFGLLVAQNSVPGVASVVTMALASSIAAVVRIRPPAVSGDGFAQPEATFRKGDAPEEPLESMGFACDAARQEPRLSGDDPSLQLLLRRHRDKDGERIELQARLEFVAGAREAVLHVPFWPALASAPEIECEPLDGDDIELRVTSAEPYGVRIEGRLPSAVVTSRTVLIGVEVHSSGHERRTSAAA